MRRDKQAAKKKKKALARARQAHTRTASGSLALARRSPFGPAFASPQWQSDELPPALVTVVITRALPDGRLVAQMLLVDRTCLGVKNAHVMDAMSPREVGGLLERFSQLHGEMQELDVATVQSIVFGAVRYADDLGFDPHPDFDAAHAGPPPETLESTPLSARTRPFYVPGPEDDSESIIDMLVEAVGEDGFDLPETFDELDLPPDERALQEAIRDWTEIFEADQDAAFDPAMRAYIHAVFGEIPKPGTEVDEEIFSSLPNFWTIFHWPLAGGTNGLLRAQTDKRIAEHRASIDALAKTEARLVDVMSVDVSANLATCVDVVSGEPLSIRTPSSMTGLLTRWTRAFGYLTPMQDGTFYPPATLVAHRWFRNVPVDELFEALSELTKELRLPDAALSRQQQLTRWGALAGPLLDRLKRPTKEQAAIAEKKVYLVNLDGERFELHEARLCPKAAVTKKLLAALASADDFLGEQNGFRWRESVNGGFLPEGGIDGYVVPASKSGELQITASSTLRFGRLVRRLSELAGAALEVKDLDVTRPWEDSQARIVADEAPGVRRVIVGSKTMTADAPAVVARVAIAELQRAIEEDVPALGGRPRDLVRSEEGRHRVESWLREQELNGLPDNTEGAFLDLDPIRRALGMEEQNPHR